MSSDPITYGEYWTEVGALAQRISDEARDARRDVGDVLHETIDGHGWVIYTRKALEMLMHTSSDDCVFDEGNGLDDCGSMAEAYSRAAFFALRADVASHANFYDWRETDDDDETDEAQPDD